MEQQTRWQDWINVLFGVWLFVSPWVLGFSHIGAAAWNAYILGVAVFVFAVIALFSPQIWEEWINLILGIWLIISPFILAYAAQHPVAMWNSIIMGILVGGDAFWAAVQPQRPTTPAH